MHAGEKVRPVGFDFHAPAASKALLTPPEFAIDKSLVDRHPSGQPRKKRHQRLAMGFAGSEIAQHVEKAL